MLQNLFGLFNENKVNPNCFQLILHKDKAKYNGSRNTFTVGYVSKTYCTSIKDTGCLIMLIEESNGDANGIFCLTKSDKYKQGNISILSQSAKSNDQCIRVCWNPLEYPSIIYHDSSENQRICKFNVRIINVI